MPEGSVSPRPPADAPDPELYVKGFGWPASRTTKGDTIKLSELRGQTGEPITQILHEAVTTYYRVRMEAEQERSSSDPLGREYVIAII